MSSGASSQAPPPKRRKRGRGRLAAAFAAFLIAGAILLFLLLQGAPGIILSTTTTGSRTLTTGAGAPHINIEITPAKPALVEYLSDVSPIPVAVTFAASPTGVGSFSFFWNFGDGTNSTDQSVTHVFAPNCYYRITLNTTNAIGPSSSGVIDFSLFNYKRVGGEIIACPQQGTAGITKVTVLGGYYTPSSALPTLMNGSPLANVTTDVNGDWAVNATGTMRAHPEVEGTLYNFTTSPNVFTGTFLSLEGVRDYPTKGLPGDPFTVEGRSYPAYATVEVYLGGVDLGQAQCDEDGTFVANVTVPSSIRYAGIYPITTSPPVEGAQATFKIPVSSATPAPPSTWYWPWILAVPGGIMILALFFLWRRRRPVDLEVYQEQLTEPFDTVWAVRVWANKDLAKCRMTYDNTPLQTIVSPTEARAEMPLQKGKYLDFRVPSSLTIVWNAWVVVKDGDKTMISQKFEDIPHAKSR